MYLVYVTFVHTKLKISRITIVSLGKPTRKIGPRNLKKNVSDMEIIIFNGYNNI